MKEPNRSNRFRSDWLETLYSVGKFKTMEKAAQELRIDPGTVRYHIRGLEVAWGRKIFLTKRWTVPKVTPFGKWLYKYAVLEHTTRVRIKRAQSLIVSFEITQNHEEAENKDE